MKRARRHTQRNAGQKRRSSRLATNEFAPPRTLEEFFSMSERDQEVWNNVGQAVTTMRTERVSARKTAQKFDLNLRTFLRLARAALRKLRNGRWVAKSRDRLLRVLVIPTRKGLSEIGVRDSRQASLLGKYWNAVERYRDTGDGSALREFRGKCIIDASGKRVPLLTDLHDLDRLGSAGVLSFESLYGKAA
jgi:hypothetical protein